MSEKLVKINQTRIDQAGNYVGGALAADGDTVYLRDGDKDIVDGLALVAAMDDLAVLHVLPSFRGSIAPNAYLKVNCVNAGAGKLIIEGAGLKFRIAGNSTGAAKAIDQAYMRSRGTLDLDDTAVAVLNQTLGLVNVSDAVTLGDVVVSGGVMVIAPHASDDVANLVVAGQQEDGRPPVRGEVRMGRDWSAMKIGGFGKVVLDAYDPSTEASVAGGTIEMTGGYLDFQRGVPSNGTHNFYAGVIDTRKLKATVTSAGTANLYSGITLIRTSNGPQLTFNTTNNYGYKTVIAD